MFYMTDIVWDLFLDSKSQLDVKSKLRAVAYIVDHLEEEGYRTDAPYDAAEREVIEQRAQHFLGRYLNHKLYENERFPNESTARECADLEDTLTNMRPVTG